MHLLHDLTHSGMTQALQMRDEGGLIGPVYPNRNQTQLLWFSVKAVMFAITAWPGAEQKYFSEIKQRSERYVQMMSEWKSPA